MKTFAAFLFGGLLLALGGCDAAPSPAAEAAPAEHRSAVRVAEARLTQGADTLRLPGVVRAGQRAQPAFLHAGHLAARFVARGERVIAGQRLASLQNPALGPAVAAAEAQQREIEEQLVQLEADYRRARELREQGLGSEERLDRALAQLKAARQARERALARVAEARDQLADAVLRAPFDGTVSDLLIEPGDFVRAGQPVLVLAGRAGLEIELSLPEGLRGQLQTGDAVKVSSLSSGAETAGRIRELGLARDGRLAPAVISLEEADAWEPGMSVHVTLTRASEAALTVPLAAIVDPGTGRTRVYRVAGDRAVLIPVQAGRLAGGRVEVRGELEAGDRVVVAEHQQLLDGDLLEILP